MALRVSWEGHQEGSGGRRLEQGGGLGQSLYQGFPEKHTGQGVQLRIGQSE